MAASVDGSMGPDALRFRSVMGRFATGVTVVTAVDSGGDPLGFTANSLSSVSLEPPLVSICVGLEGESHDLLIDGAAFAVNILSTHQEDVARRFSSIQTRSARWEGLAWKPGVSGSPLLEGTLGWIDCRVWKTVPAGDHTIVIGEVMDAQAGEAPPLLFFRGQYRQVED